MAIAFTCEHCGVVAERPVGHVNRSRAKGMALYCGRECVGLARRLWKSEGAKRAEKAAYDAAYRTRNAEERKAQKAAYHRRTYDPVAAASIRAKRMPQHVEYCRRPEYRAGKRQYDRRRRADMQFGPFADAFLILQDLESEVLSRMSRYDIDLANGKLNKKLRRRREYVQLVSG